MALQQQQTTLKQNLGLANNATNPHFASVLVKQEAIEEAAHHQSTILLIPTDTDNLIVIDALGPSDKEFFTATSNLYGILADDEDTQMEDEDTVPLKKDVMEMDGLKLQNKPEIQPKRMGNLKGAYIIFQWRE